MFPVLYLQVGKVEPFSKAGFDELVVEVEGLEDYAGALIKIRTLNENYIAWEPQGSGTEPEDGYVLTCFPDLICVINSETGEWQPPLYTLKTLC